MMKLIKNYLVLLLLIPLIGFSQVEIEIDPVDDPKHGIDVPDPEGGRKDGTRPDVPDDPDKKDKPDETVEDTGPQKEIVLGGKHIKPALSERPANSDKLFYMNGDQLSVAIKKLESGNLTWSRDDYKQDVESTIQNIKGVSFFKQVGAMTGRGYRIVLTNDDILYGQIEKMDDKFLYMDTWYAGQLVIDRTMLYQIDALENRSLFNAIDKLANWENISNNKARWVIDKGTLKGSGSLGRKVKFLDNMMISMKVKCTGRFPSFRLGFFCNKPQDYSNGVRLNFSQRTVVLDSRMNRSSYQSSYLNADLTKETELNIIFDKPNKQITLKADGRKVKTWDRIDFSNFKGDYFFVYSTQLFEMSKFTISTWHGDHSFEDEDRPNDIINFANNELAKGKALSMAKNTLKLKTDLLTVNVPVNNIKTIQFNTDDAQRSRRRKNDIKAYFAAGGHITLNFKELANGKVIGYSENFKSDGDKKMGEVAIDMNALVGIRFMVYNEEIEHLSFEK